MEPLQDLERPSPVTTQLYLTYKSTYCAIALYIYPRARTVATILLAPSLQLPTASNILMGFSIPPLNRCYCRQLSGLSTINPQWWQVLRINLKQDPALCSSVRTQ